MKRLRLDKIGEAAGATVAERRDAHKAVVSTGQMRGAVR
jgi:hypothetical protein